MVDSKVTEPAYSFEERTLGIGTIGLIVVALLAAYFIMVYNRLVTHKNRFKNAFSQIDVQLQRRYELIPNLVEIASKYISHEKETLTAVIEARNQASDACKAASENPDQSGLVGALAQAEQKLGNAMGKFNMVMEDYPELKADESLRDLHDELVSTENRVTYARQAYSDSVMRYNTEREQFPAVVVANTCNFNEADLFEAANEAVYEAPKVNFG